VSVAYLSNNTTNMIEDCYGGRGYLCARNTGRKCGGSGKEIIGCGDDFSLQKHGVFSFNIYDEAIVEKLVQLEDVDVVNKNIR